VTNKSVHSVLSKVGGFATLIVEEGTVSLSHPSLDSSLVFLQSSEARVDGVDGEASQGVGHGVGLELADGLHPALLVLNLHVVEASLHNVEAIVHVPHDPRHSGETKPGGPGVVLVASLANGCASDKEESEDKVEGDEDEHDAGDRFEGDPGDSAGRSASKEALY